MSTGKVEFNGNIIPPLQKKINRYFRLPEVFRELSDPDKAGGITRIFIVRRNCQDQYALYSGKRWIHRGSLREA